MAGYEDYNNLWGGLERKFVRLQEELREINPQNAFLKYKDINEVTKSSEYLGKTNVAALDLDLYLNDLEKEIEKLKVKASAGV